MRDGKERLSLKKAITAGAAKNKKGHPGGLEGTASGEWRAGTSADTDAGPSAGLDHASRVRELQRLEAKLGAGQPASGRGLWYSVET